MSTPLKSSDPFYPQRVLTPFILILMIISTKLVSLSPKSSDPFYPSNDYFHKTCGVRNNMRSGRRMYPQRVLTPFILILMIISTKLVSLSPKSSDPFYPSNDYFHKTCGVRNNMRSGRRMHRVFHNSRLANHGLAPRHEGDIGVIRRGLPSCVRRNNLEIRWFLLANSENQGYFAYGVFAWDVELRSRSTRGGNS